MAGEKKKGKERSKVVKTQRCEEGTYGKIRELFWQDVRVKVNHQFLPSSFSSFLVCCRHSNNFQIIELNLHLV